MRSGMLITMLMVAMVALTQSKPETKSEPAPKVMQTQIVELPLTRSTEPLILFDHAMKDARGRCRVHHHPLKVATIPIQYGLLPSINKEGYSQAEEKAFPNAITYYEAGCTVMGAKEAKVLQCRKCLEAKKAWISRPAAFSTRLTQTADSVAYASW